MSSPLWSGSGYQGRHGGDSLRRMAAMPAPDGNPIPKPAPAPAVIAVEEQAVEVSAPVAEEIPQPVPVVPVPSSLGVRIPDRGVRTDMRARVLRTLTGGRAAGLEDEASWRSRVDLARLQAPVPLGHCGAIVVAQPKGGVGKTPTAMLIDATLRANTRCESLVWDLNDNGGGRWVVPASTAAGGRLVDTAQRGAVTRSTITSSMVIQDGGAYTVLPSREGAENLTATEFAAVWGTLRDWFDQTIIDTGNSLASPNFLNALDIADVVVIPTDYSEAALAPTLALARRLEAKWGEEWGSRVVLVPTGHIGDMGQVWLESVCAHTVPVPYDAHIDARDTLRYSDLAPATRAAGIRLGAAIMDIYRTNTINN